jgi:hypothetical protein
MKIEDPFPDLLTTPRNPSKEFKNDCPQFGNRFQTGFVILPNEIYFALQ